MKIFPFDQQPSRRQLRQFGLALGVLGIVAGGILWFRHGRIGVATVVWSVSGAAAVVGWFVPDTLRAVYRVLMLIGAPIGFLVSRIGMTLVYFFVVTPIGLVRRWMGRDALGWEWERQKTTYWEPRDQESDDKRYFHQY